MRHGTVRRSLPPAAALLVTSVSAATRAVAVRSVQLLSPTRSRVTSAEDSRRRVSALIVLSCGANWRRNRGVVALQHRLQLGVDVRVVDVEEGPDLPGRGAGGGVLRGGHRARRGGRGRVPVPQGQASRARPPGRAPARRDRR